MVGAACLVGRSPATCQLEQLNHRHCWTCPGAQGCSHPRSPAAVKRPWGHRLMEVWVPNSSLSLRLTQLHSCNQAGTLLALSIICRRLQQNLPGRRLVHQRYVLESKTSIFRTTILLLGNIVISCWVNESNTWCLLGWLIRAWRYCCHLSFGAF